MAISPMLPLWTDAYLGDTHHLSTLEHGAYLLLLITAWRSKDGTLPDDNKILSKYCRMTVDKWQKIRPVLEPFFTIENGIWKQGRLLDERKADFDFRKSQSKKAKARHLKNKETAHAVAHAQHMPPPTPTPSPIKKEISKDISQKNQPPKEEMVPKKKTASRIPIDWDASQDLGKWAEDQGLSVSDVLREIESFKDHWTAASGEKARKHDWDAAFRTWIRNTAKWKKEKAR